VDPVSGRTEGDSPGTGLTRFKSAAFFDVDRTLIPGTSMEWILARSLIGKEIPGRFAWVPFLIEGLRLLPYGLSVARKANKGYLAGARPDDVRAWAEAVFERHIRSRLGPEGHEWIGAERARDRAIILITGMPDLMIGPILRTYQPDLAIATVLESKNDGRLSGRRASVHPYGRVKLKIAQDLALRHGWDLTRCSAYGDHATDAHILAGVGEPNAVDPDKRLRRLALLRGWPIRDRSPRH
jgi:HAD superfamily hydrolase (TIGR01490 family)